MVSQRRRSELRLGAVLVGVLALGAAEGLVLGLVVGPVLELLGRVLLELLDLLLGLLGLLLDLLGLGLLVALVVAGPVLLLVLLLFVVPLLGLLLVHSRPSRSFR